jgi:tripartite ATP-independent transporter DctM subunit
MTLGLLILMMLVLLALRVPVAFALLLPCLLYVGLSADISLGVAQQRMVAGLNSFPLLAVPLFIMTGYLSNTAGLADRLFRFLMSLLGRVPGSLGYVNVGSSLMFSWMSGAAIADAAALGSVLVPAMRKRGYDEHFALGLTAAASMLGPIMPPSIPAIIYAVTAGVSVGALFFAGVLPALVLAADTISMIAPVVRAVRNSTSYRPRSESER